MIYRSRFAVVLLAAGLVLGIGASELARRFVGCAEAAPETKTAATPKIQRFGSVIGVKRETLDKYVALHKAAWPEVLAKIKEVNIHNYSIYLGELDDGKLYLFSYFEYTGDDFAGDMKRMAADPKTREWWSQTDPLQVPLKNRKPGEHWMTMKEVFHCE